MCGCVCLSVCPHPPQIPIVGINWYDGGEGCSDPTAPTLAVAFENGRVQIMRNEGDEEPVLIDTEMRLTQCKWNSNGTVLALSGSAITPPSAEKVPSRGCG